MPRYQIGQTVLIDDREESRHHRVPDYAKGHCGVVTAICPAAPLPEEISVDRKRTASVPVYRICLDQTRLWHHYQPDIDSLEIDIHEHWLKPA